MFLNYKYRLLTRRTHRRALEKAREEARLLYNAALQERISAWEKARKRITRFDQCKSLTAIRGDDAEPMSRYSVTMGRWALKRVEDAFTGFFGRLKAKGGKAGFPRYRSRVRWNSFGFSEWSGIRLVGGRLSIKGIAASIRVNMHRPLPAEAVPCSAVITEQGGIWYLCVQVETPSPKRVERTPENTVGCDWGVENAMTLDDGRLFETVQPGRTRAAAVRRAQRAVARCKRGSKSRRKRVLALGRLRRAEANARTTRLHKIAAAIVATTPYVAVEALQVRNMTASAAGTIEAPGKSVAQKSGLNRSILDGAPARLISFIRYKAECAGGEMRAGNARGTSIECAVCGARVPKALSTRVHRCDCGFCVHRDFNSACNIRYRVFGEMSPAILRFREHEIEAGVGLGGHNHRNGGDAPGNISLAIEANQPEISN